MTLTPTPAELTPVHTDTVANAVSPAIADELPSLMDPLEEQIVKYYPNLYPAVKAYLAVFGAMSLKDRTKPLSLIFEGGSGFGKTAVLQMAFSDKAGDRESIVYRSDAFSSKAFVTHAANVKEEDLPAMDLLPKLKNRVLVTKELAPLFRGREQELQERFSILISVLDGKGFTSDTGMRGRRGYQEKIVFNWVGATTPLPPATHRLMSQLGTRLLFYEVPNTQPSRDELLAFAEAGSSAEAENACQNAVNQFLRAFFGRYPVNSVNPAEIAIPASLTAQIVDWAMLVVAGRAEIKYDKDAGDWEPIAANPPEAPYKVINYLKELAQGHALIHGRHEVSQSDLALVGDVAISSIPGYLRPIVRELRRSGEVSTPECVPLCRVSAPTARGYLQQLSLLGICDLTKGAANRNTPDVVTLAEQYNWLRN